jgi:hypothetical protein
MNTHTNITGQGGLDGVLKVAKFRLLPATEHGKAGVRGSGSSVIKLAQGNGNRGSITDCH